MAQNFIGSIISLISESDIRYEGRLHNLNSEDSSVSLEGVRSFGTEGRLRDRGMPEKEIEPAPNVYEFVVFRGSQIKDLRVKEAPPIMSMPVPPAYPPPGYPSAQHGLYPPYPPSMMPPTQPWAPVSKAPFHSMQPPTPLHPSSEPPNASQQQPPKPTKQSPSQQQPRQATPRQTQKPQQSQTPPKREPTREQAPEPPIPVMHTAPANEASFGTADNMVKGLLAKPAKALDEVSTHSTPRKQRSRQQADTSGDQEKPRGAQRGARRENLSARIAVPDSDFDFESSNAKFTTSHDANGLPGSDEPEQSYYDKSKQFFDNISCESKTKEEMVDRRAKFQEERQRNIETFGQANVEHKRHHGRGGGHRGHGRGRGRGGQRNSGNSASRNA